MMDSGIQKPSPEHNEPAENEGGAAAEAQERLLAQHALARGGNQRRRESAKRAMQRIAERKKESRRLLTIGGVLVAFGIFLIALTLARVLLGSRAWVDLALAGLSVVLLIPIGIYLILSSTMMVRLLQKEAGALAQALEDAEGSSAKG